MFDDKLNTEAELKFDGVNNGSAWKTKVERYMVYKAPTLRGPHGRCLLPQTS